MRRDDSLVRLRDVLHRFCEADVWGVVDGVDALSPLILSRMTTLLGEINKVRTLGIKEFSLGGRRTRVNANSAVTFVTRKGELHDRVSK